MQLMSADEAREFANAAILHQLTEGIIITDFVGAIKFVNDAAAAMHGVAELNVRPNAYSGTYHLYRENGQPYPSHELPLARAVRGETVRDARWKIRRPDGEEVLAVGTAQPLHGPDGRRIGAILTLRDHTAIDALERALSEANHRLAAHAREASVAREKANAPAETSAKIKAALADILGHADRLLAATSSNEIRRHCEHVRSTAATLAALVDGRPRSERGKAEDTRLDYRDLQSGSSG